MISLYLFGEEMFIEKKNEQHTYELISEWLEEYRLAQSESKRTRTKALIVARMLPIIRRIARTIARRSYDPIDDMVQAGSIGLLKAIDSYSKNLNDNFKIYAGYLIIGEMKHYLRDKLNTIRVPRHIQELSYRINTFTSTLTLEELNELTNDEVADVLNVSSRQVDYAMQANRRKSTISLEEIYNLKTDNLNYEEVLADSNFEETTDLEDAKIILKDIIQKLPEKYQELIHLYYNKDMSQREIAEHLKVTPMTVSRRLKKCFNLLYKMISEKDAGERINGNSIDDIDDEDEVV